MPNLTIEDLHNPELISGFTHVRYCDSNGTRPKPFIASANSHAWRGPRRTTALEAAQDYCDYINNNFVQPSFTLKSAGHPTKTKGPQRRRNDGHVVAPKRPKEGPGYVYLVVEVCDRRWKYGKIGESRDEGKYRLAGLQTGNRRKLKCVGQIKTAKRLSLEARLHQKYLPHNELGEWFRLTDDAIAEFGLKRPK